MIDKSWLGYEWVHDDYDGPEDNRCGYGKTLAEVFTEIDWVLDDD